MHLWKHEKGAHGRWQELGIVYGHMALICVCMNVYICICMHTAELLLNFWKQKQPRRYVIYICIYMYKYHYACMCVCIYIYIYMHAHIKKNLLPKF
jgi:hypothetical protein